MGFKATLLGIKIVLNHSGAEIAGQKAFSPSKMTRFRAPFQVGEKTICVRSVVFAPSHSAITRRS